MATKMFMNISEVNVLKWCAHFAKTLCFTELLSRPSTVFFAFLGLYQLDLPFPHSPHCDCSLKSRLKKKRCLSFFYCIILPFYLVMLKRMSYNVESAKSVLFSQACNLKKKKNISCVNIHITKIRTKCFTWRVGAAV